jgi:hypothetical protein
MGLALWVWLAYSTNRPAWLAGGAGVVLGGGIYAICLLVMGVQEVRGLARLIVAKARKLVSARSTTSPEQ